MMKKAIAMLLILGLMLAPAACGAGAGETTQAQGTSADSAAAEKADAKDPAAAEEETDTAGKSDAKEPAGAEETADAEEPAEAEETADAEEPAGISEAKESTDGLHKTDAGKTAAEAAGTVTPGSWQDIDFNYTAEQAAAMSNFNNHGRCVIVDNCYYGNCFDVAGNSPNLIYGVSFDPDTMTETGRTYLSGLLALAGSWFNFFYYSNGYVYAVDPDGDVLRVDLAIETPELVDVRNVYYLIVDGDRMYYTDAETSRLYSAEPDGSDEVLLIDKAVYYPFSLGDGFWLYQDDDDNASLHIMNTDSGEDWALTDEPTYCPVIYDGYIYAEVEADGGYSLIRIDPADGTVEYSNEVLEADYGIGEFYGRTVIVDGTLAADPENWDAIAANDLAIGVNGYFYSDGTHHVEAHTNSDGDVDDFIIYSENEALRDVTISVNTFEE